MDLNNKNERPKQIIVVRKDLNMPPPKMAAQVCHASEGAIFSLMKMEDNKFILDFDQIDNSEIVKTWILEKFTKVLVGVKSEIKLMNIYNKAKERGLPVSLIQDAGYTFFDKPTYTAVGIGPCSKEQLEGITNKLQLL